VESGPIYRDNRKTEGDAYLTDAFSDEAAAFIRQHKDEKFFLYVAYNAVHPPLQVPPPYTEKLGAIADKRRRNMIGMIHALDDGVGRILAALRETGLERNTVVFFVNDNGGTKLASNKPLSGYKVSLWEGGIRVPFIVRWPARLPAGKIYDQPVISLDIMPTAVAAAGGQLPADRIIDGVNLVPYLAGEKTGAPHEHLIWRAATHETYAVRSGNWKLLHMFKGKPQLFDLSADIAEQNDLAAQHPDRVASLCKAYEEWKAQMVEPLF
jgi:arylsulfatase A-like enzyme